MLQYCLWQSKYALFSSFCPFNFAAWKLLLCTLSEVGIKDWHFSVLKCASWKGQHAAYYSCHKHFSVTTFARIYLQRLIASFYWGVKYAPLRASKKKHFFCIIRSRSTAGAIALTPQTGKRNGPSLRALLLCIATVQKRRESLYVRGFNFAGTFWSKSK